MTNPDHGPHARDRRSGALHRDPREAWPDDEPVGSFDITPSTLDGYASTAHMLFVCPNSRRCAVLLGPTAVTRSAPDRLCVWGWDGNLEQPTITPSINCVAQRDGKPTGGCGWHGFITQGRFV
jgi:hypothetical protein